MGAHSMRKAPSRFSWNGCILFLCARNHKDVQQETQRAPHQHTLYSAPRSAGACVFVRFRHKKSSSSSIYAGLAHPLVPELEDGGFVAMTPWSATSAAPASSCSVSLMCRTLLLAEDVALQARLLGPPAASARCVGARPAAAFPPPSGWFPAGSSSPTGSLIQNPVSI